MYMNELRKRAMRHVFRAVISCVLCLLTAPALCLSGQTEDPSAAGSPGRQVKSDAENKAPTTMPPSRRGRKHPSALPEGRPAATALPTHGWVKVESGSRPAYVGIHGGTAPLSLMHSADGMLIAFTGQTGNDFMQVLKGGNASRAAREEQRLQPASQTALLQNWTVASLAGEVAPAVTEPAALPNNPATDSGAVAVKAAGARQIAAETSSSSPACAGEGERAKTAPRAVPAAGPKSVPAGGAVLVFASSNQAAGIKASAGSCLPFGLTPAAGAPPAAGAEAARTVASFSKPLKLGSYQRLLAYAGRI
jgi:hypothetical protein